MKKNRESRILQFWFFAILTVALVVVHHAVASIAIQEIRSPERLNSRVLTRLYVLVPLIVVILASALVSLRTARGRFRYAAYAVFATALLPLAIQLSFFFRLLFKILSH